MVVLWQDECVRYRDTAAGQQQREALARFQKDAGLDATVAAGLVGLSYPQYNRYLWGKLPLRTDQVPLFAAAYGITKAELTRALGLLDDEIDPALRARAAEAVGPDLAPEMAATVDQMARVLKPRDPKFQDDVLRQVRDVLADGVAPTKP